MTFHGFTRSKHVPCQRAACDTSKSTFYKKNARIDPHCAAAFQEGFYTACTHLHLQSCRCLVQLHFLDLQLGTGTKKVAGILCNGIFTSACLRLYVGAFRYCIHIPASIHLHLCTCIDCTCIHNKFLPLEGSVTCFKQCHCRFEVAGAFW